MKNEERHLIMLNRLLDLDEGLSECEVEFVESLHKQGKAGYVFTNNQLRKLEELFDLHC